MIRDYIYQPLMTGAEILATAATDMDRMFGDHQGERCDKWRQYLPVYDRHLTPFRNTSVRFLEIGVANGGSFEIWRRYLGEDASLNGLDINQSDEASACLAGVRARLYLGNQSDRAVLNQIVQDEGGALDVVIDDGSHVPADQIATFEALYPRLAPGGVYICEDTHTSYFGMPKRAGTFVEYAKDRIDDLHSWYLDDSAGISDVFALATTSVLFYDSMVVFEKSSQKTPPRRLVIGRGA